LIWIISLIIEELKEVNSSYFLEKKYFLKFENTFQFFQNFENLQKDLFLFRKWKISYRKYFSDKWNIFDLCGCLLYVLSIITDQR
jgi:hypothetical protein